MSINVNVTGVQGSGYAGAHDLLLLQSGDFLLLEDGGRILTAAGSEIQGEVSVSSVTGTGQVGSVETQYGAQILVVGVQGTGRVGTVFLWDDIDTSQTPNWVDVI